MRKPRGRDSGQMTYSTESKNLKRSWMARDRSFKICRMSSRRNQLPSLTKRLSLNLWNRRYSRLRTRKTMTNVKSKRRRPTSMKSQASMTSCRGRTRLRGKRSASSSTRWSLISLRETRRLWNCVRSWLRLRRTSRCWSWNRRGRRKLQMRRLRCSVICLSD